MTGTPTEQIHCIINL